MSSETFSVEVFECTEVAVFKIPPGDISISDWSKYEANPIWKGSLVLLEQETFLDAEEPVVPAERIRLKLELFNRNIQKEPWAVVWYNPIHQSGDVTVTLDTIQRTEVYRLFKIIAQMPGTDYEVGGLKQTQVALGLKFSDKIDAYTFTERLQSYQKQFKSYIEQYEYEMENKQFEREVEDMVEDMVEELGRLSLEESEDDFGEFVGND